MHRFYLPPSQARGATLVLPESEARHALRVLRLQRGDSVTVLDGAGQELRCEVAESKRKEVVLAVQERKVIPPLPCKFTLMQAIAKGRAMDSIIQKATEMGVHRIVPLLSERTVVQVGAEEASHKIERWEAIAIESIKQCGSAWLPNISAPVALAEFIARDEPFDLQFVASLQSGAQNPRRSIESFFEARHRSPESIAAWVGPEGDFSPSELEAIQAAGAVPITLGQLTLRCDTAAICCLSVLNYELQCGGAARARLEN